MNPLLLIPAVPVLLGVWVFIANERAVWERKRQASERLRREYPTVHGGPRL